MRRAAKTDENQKEIVAAFRGLGFTVAITSALGQGFPDLVVGKWGRNFLIEVKDGEKPPSKRQLTDAEEEFASGWRGQYDVIKSVSEVMEFNGRVFELD